MEKQVDDQPLGAAADPGGFSTSRTAGREIEMSLTEKRIKTLLLVNVAILLVFQWPPGPANTKAADIALVLAIIYAWPAFWKHRQIVRFPLILPQWLIFLGGLFATMTSLDRSASIIAVVQDLYLYLCFLSLVNMADDEADLHKMMKAWVMMACLQSILMAATQLRIGARLPIPGLKGSAREAAGLIGQPNLAGVYLMESLFVLLATRYPKRTWLRIAIVALLSVAILATRSKGALAGSLIGLWVVLNYWAWTRTRSLLLQISATALLGAAICAILIISISLGASGTAQESGGLAFSLSQWQGKFKARIEILQHGWKIYQTQPLGIGPNVFGSLMIVEVEPGELIKPEEHSTHLHNDYFAYLVERGPVGFTGLLLLLAEIFICLKSSIEITENAPEKRFEAVALGAGVASSFITGLAYEVMHWRHHWVLIALVFVQNRLLRIQYGGGNGQNKSRAFDQL